jgi:hypothetical protein
MDRKLIKQLRKALMLEAFYSGISSLSSILNDTEGELEDLIKYIDKKFSKKKVKKETGKVKSKLVCKFPRLSSRYDKGH